MRRRNRKKNLYAHVLPVPLAGLVVGLVTLALAYLYLECRCQTLGRELAALEQHRDTLIEDRAHEQFKWTTLKSPQSLERALQANGLSMTWPSHRQVVRLRRDDVPADAWESGAAEQFASRE